MSSEKKIYIISDGTGETASQMVKAALVQFPDQTPLLTRHKDVRRPEQIEAICEDALESGAMIIFTIVSPELRTVLLRKSHELGIATVDLLGPLLYGLAAQFGYEPRAVAGLLRNVNEAYFQRIDAMEYTIAHDDGRDLTGLELADVIILGISRTSKTPLSMYLSHQGFKVANIPLIMGYDIPPEVKAVDPRRVICLTIDPEELSRIRRARLQRLGSSQGGDYADPHRVYEEVEFAREAYASNRKWTVFNVTGKALEETASEIIKLMNIRRLTPGNRSTSNA